MKIPIDAERLSVDPAMRHVVGERAKDQTPQASPDWVNDAEECWKT